MIAKRRIGELIDEGAILEMQDGNHGEKHPTSKDYVEEGIPFLMARDFKGSEVDLQGACKISKNLADSLRIGFARSGDVLSPIRAPLDLSRLFPMCPTM